MNPAFIAILAIGAVVAIGLLSREQARARRNAAYEAAATILGATYVAPPNYGGDPSINGSFMDRRFSIFVLKKQVPGGPPDGRSMLHLELEGVPGNLRFRAPPPPEAPLKLGSEWLSGDPAFDKAVEVGGDEPRGRAILTAEGRKMITTLIAGGGFVMEGKLVQEFPMEKENPDQFPEEMRKLGEVMKLLSAPIPQLVERLQTNLKEPFLAIRRDSLESLVRLGGATPTAVSVLLEDPDLPLRIRACELSEQPGPLRELISSKEGKHRPEAVQALAKLANRRIPAAVLVMREELPALVADADRHVQLVAVGSLVVMHRLEALKLVKTVLETGPGPVVLQQLARVTGKIGGSEKLLMEVRLPAELAAAVTLAEDLLMELIKLSDESVRSAAGEGLGRIGTIRALEELENLEDNPSANTAAVAIRRRVFPESTTPTP